MVNPSYISSSHRLKGRWGRSARPLAIFLSLLTAGVASAQIGEFLPREPLGVTPSPTKITSNISDSKWHHSLWGKVGVLGFKPRFMTVNVLSNGSKEHILSWYSVNFQGAINISLPATGLAPDFTPRGIELYDDWNQVPQLKAYVIGDLVRAEGAVPVVIPFLFKINKFIQQPIVHLLDTLPVAGSGVNKGFTSSMAQDHLGEFIAAWVTKGSPASAQTQRLRSTAVPPYIEKVGGNQTIPISAFGMNPTDRFIAVDVAMNESQNVKIAVASDDSGFWGHVRVLHGTIDQPGAGPSQILSGRNGDPSTIALSIAMRTVDGAPHTLTLPGIDQDYAVTWVDDPYYIQGVRPFRVMMSGEHQGVSSGLIHLNRTLEQMRGEVTNPQIDGGKDHYEVVWNYLDKPEYIPGSGKTWEVLSQGVSSDLRIIDVGSNGNFGHKCISDTHPMEQYAGSVAIPNYPFFNDVVFSYSSIIGPGVAVNPGNIANPAPGSTYSFQYKPRQPGRY